MSAVPRSATVINNDGLMLTCDRNKSMESWESWEEDIEESGSLTFFFFFYFRSLQTLKC